MNLFKRKTQPIQYPPSGEFEQPSPYSGEEAEAVPEVENVTSRADLQDDREHFDSAQEASDRVAELLGQKDAVLEQFCIEARARGLDDQAIVEAVADGIREGALPRIAERRMPLRDGMRPIFILDDLPEQQQDYISVVISGASVKVGVREFKNVTEELIDNGRLLVLNQGANDPTILNPSSEWTDVISKLKSAITK